MSPRLILCLLTLGFWPACAVADDWLGIGSPPPIRSAQEVRYLPPEEAARGHAVKLTGIVTHVLARDNSFYIQDETAGIHVRATPDAIGLLQGETVEVVGVTDRGEFAPSIAPKSVRRLGKGNLPMPWPFDLSISESRWLHGQWVRAWAVIKEVRTEKGMTYFDVWTPRGFAVLVVAGEWGMAALQMRKHAVIVNGVCEACFEDRQIRMRPNILLAQLPERLPTPIEPPGGSAAPPRMIDTLLTFAPDPHPGARRVKIAGVVTAAPLPQVLAIQDESGGSLIVVENPPAQFSIGDRVEAYGYLEVEGRRIALIQATVKKLGQGALPAPAAMRASELAQTEARHAIRVELEGRVEEMRKLEDWTVLTLDDEGTRFEAYLAGSPQQNRLDAVEPGTRVTVVGVPMDITPDHKAPTVPGVFLNDRDALNLGPPPPKLQQGQTTPSWWTDDRLGYALGGFAAVLLLGGSWLLALRVQVRRAANEVKRQYEEKAQLKDQLRQATKLEAVGRLAGGIAHDFNNLLTVINGCAELLAEESAQDGGKLSELTADIRRAGERAASLTGQLLTFSRKREIQISAVDLNEVMRDTVRLLDRVLGEHIRIETSLATDLPAVRGEPGLLHQVVMNLAVNAKDAMPHGGVLSFSTSLFTEMVEDEPGLAREFVRLTVSDTGVGMSDEVKARIFEPFFTTKEVGEGTGLGLATVYGAIQTVRGRIRVDSAIGRGTKFFIDFRIHGDPVSDTQLILPSTPTPLPHSRLVKSTQLAGATVLVVEDSEMVRDMLVTGLKNEGAVVLPASRPDHALRTLASHAGSIDVMVTDVVMPGMSGPVLAERVRELRPGMRIVFISGYTPDEVHRQGVLEEQVEFLQKPFTPDQLTRRLLRLLERGAPA